MTTSRNERSHLIRVKGSALPVVSLTSESELTTAVGELIRVKGSAMPVVSLTGEPVEPMATMHIRRPLANAADAEAVRQRMSSLAAKINELEVMEGRHGFRLDEANSGVRAGEVVLVLVPNDPVNAVETCKRIANILVNASPGVTVKVFTADQPETPVYELAV